MEEATGEAFADKIAALEEDLRRSREEAARLQAALAEATTELSQRAAQMRRAEKLARIGYWQSDLRTGKVIWSEGMANLLGLASALQRHIPGELYEYVHPEDQPIIRRAVEEAVAGTGIYMAEFRASTVAGEEHYVRILGEIEFQGGRPALNFGVAQDITPVKKAEAAVRSSEERSRRQAIELGLIYATAPIGLCVLDTSLRFIHVNECLAQINGVSSAEHLGKTVREVIPGIADELEPFLRRVLETGEPVVDFVLRGQTGSDAKARHTWVSQFWPLKEDGRVTGINVVVEEITERERLEESRRRAQEFLALAEHSTDLVSRFDRNLRRSYCNPAVEKVLGQPREFILGKTNEEVGLPPELARHWREVMQRVFATGEAYAEEFAFPAVDGERYFDTRIIPERSPDGRVETLLTVSRDSTERKRMELALRESEGRYRRQAAELEIVYRYAPVGLTVLDTGLRYLRLNERLAELNGLPVAEHIGRTVAEVVPTIAPYAKEIVRRALETGETVRDRELRGETRLQPGVERIWNTQWVPLKDVDGKVWGINVVVEEITQRKRAEELLFRREQEFEALAERAPDIIARYDRNMRLLYVNPAVESVTRRPRGWYIGRTPSQMELPPHETERRERIMREIVERGREQTVDYEMQTPGGNRYFQTRLVPERGPGGRIDTVLIVDRDITELKRAQLALEELTLHDPLTGIANRRYLSRFVEREWRREVRHHHSVAVVMADIDFFKAYNDRYGHQRGDACLREVSQVLSGNLRRPTDILVRYGGEEFAVVLLESDLKSARRLAETMQHAVMARQVMHEASPVAPVVTISLGVTAAPAQAVTFAELLAAADQALYRAKQNGRNRVELEEPSRLHS